MIWKQFQEYRSRDKAVEVNIKENIQRKFVLFSFIKVGKFKGK